MMQRRARIKAKPVIAAAFNKSTKSDAVVETPEANVVAVVVEEKPVENVTPQQTQESVFNAQQQTDNTVEIAVKVGLNDGDPNSVDNSIVKQLRLTPDSAISHESHDPSPAHEEFEAKEGIPTFTEINKEHVNMAAVPEKDNDFDSGVESPISIATYVRQDDAGETSRSTHSSSASTDHEATKRAAERLADRLVNRRIAERQKARTTEFLDDAVNPSQVCVRDLIYLNPKDNPMLHTQVNESRTEVPEKRKKESNPTAHIQVPQLEIGPDGKIKINEASLVIQQSVPDIDDMVVVDETNYKFDAYKARKYKPKKWGLKETKRFYVALSMVGTDFSLMSKLFHNRTRDEIKNKFKREDKRNTDLIDTALKVRRPLDISLLAEPPSEDELKDEKLPRKKKKKTEVQKEV